MTQSQQPADETKLNSSLLLAVFVLRKAIKASHEMRELAEAHRNSWSNARSLVTLAERLEALLEHEDSLLTGDESEVPERFNASVEAMADLKDVVERLVSCSRALKYYARQIEHTDKDVQTLYDEAERLEEYSRTIKALVAD